MIKEFKSFYMCEQFPQHTFYKERLLDYFEKSDDKALVKINNDYDNNIVKLDYFQATDWDREWVNMIASDFSTHLGNLHSTFGFRSHDLKAIWFQQYTKSNQHDWHTHGENYSGVYYVELPDDVLGTEIWDGEKVIIPPVKEGDVCIFPAFMPHKSPRVTTDGRKTIISFNIEVKEFKDDFLRGLRDEEIK